MLLELVARPDQFAYNCLMSNKIPYFSDYKMEAFPFQNNPKNLDRSYKMDLDLRDCLGRAKFVL